MRKKTTELSGAPAVNLQRRVKLTMTYQLAWSAALDHGNRHMRRYGRTAWNSDDFNAASQKLDELITTHHLSA